MCVCVCVYFRVFFKAWLIKKIVSQEQIFKRTLTGLKSKSFFS